jgi:phage-related protein
MKNPLPSLKPTIFVGSSRKDLQAFPAAVRSEIGQALFEAQLGDHPRNAKPLKGFKGVLEIRDSFDGDTYRAVYTVRFEGVLYILHAFQKKSTSGIATPQRHIELVRQRLKDAETIHRATKGGL